VVDSLKALDPNRPIREATESLQKQIEASNFCAVNFRDVSALCYDNGLKRSETLL
jgi:hypothetical protein